MKVVWSLGKPTVREVFDVLRERRKLAYTTTMTMMNILAQKGHLTRVKAGRAFRYEPVRSKHQVISGLVEDFLGRVFDGAARPLMVNLARERRLSEEDLDAIRDAIDEGETS